MDNKYFGTDGIRGKVGEHPITSDFFLKLGWAVGSVLASRNRNANVIIGKDTRISGYMFESALEAGFLSAGVSVGLLGPMPTPAVAYLTRAYMATTGVVISASHNSHEDNGIKFFSEKGFKLSDELQNKIEVQLKKPIKSVASKKIGKARRNEQAIGRYIEFCKSTFNKYLNLKNLHIIVDCANGATYHIAPFVFEELGAKVTPINVKPDGLNINYKCGATNIKGLQTEVIRQEADLGIALDGDGDRVIMIDKNGVVVDGDEIVFIIAKHLKTHNKLENNAVVGTQMTNLGMRHALRDIKINFYETNVGDKYVMESMIKNKLILGGEPSGHIICLNHATTGDGVISALQVLEVIARTNKSLDELKSAMQKYPQELINIKTTNDFDINDKTLQQEIKKVESELGDKGRVLIRKSGTEPLIRVMVEGNDMFLVRKSAKHLATFIK